MIINIRIRITVPTAVSLALLMSHYCDAIQVDYRCQHNTLPKSSTADGKRGSKNTHCPATLSLTLYNTDLPRKSR